MHTEWYVADMMLAGLIVIHQFNCGYKLTIPVVFVLTNSIVYTININLNDLTLIKILYILDSDAVSNLIQLRTELQKIFCSAFYTVTIRA